MPKPHAIILLFALLVDGGSPTPRPSPALTDAGAADAGPLKPDAGLQAQPIRWPNEVRPMVVLDGPAVLAAHAALQELLQRYAKDYPGACEYSAKAMEVIVSQADGLYFVRIDHHVDRCGGVAPGFPADLHWWEVYAVTSEGKILARNPFTP